MEDRLYRYIREHELLLPPSGTVLGLSGGVDSVVLFKLLLLLEVDLHVVHVNYHLREEADADEQFVGRLCAEEGVPLTVRQSPIGEEARREGQSVQELARRVRYEVFEEVAVENGFSRVAIGHHRDDQIETILLQLVRGTGLRGLAGMPVRRPISPESGVKLVRPLLFARGSAVESYARKHSWEWRDDASNRSTKYLRTALRHEVLPRLENHVGPGGLENIARTGDLVREYLETEWKPRLERDIARWVDRREEGTVSVALEPLQDVSRVWRQELLLEVVRRFVPEIHISEAVAEELADLVDAQVGRRKEYGAHTVWRERNHLLLIPRSARPAAADRLITVGDAVDLVGVGRLALENVGEVDEVEMAAANTALVDADRVELPLRVRRWQDGDRLQPLGMAGHKNVSDLLTDEKVPSHERDRVYVVTSGENIIWVVGLRLAHEVRITPDTDTALKLSFQPVST